MRKAWLAGSLPGRTPTEAMTLALDTLGEHLLALPGGEVGRPIWAASITEELAASPLFDVVRQGNYTDYDDFTQLSAAGDLKKLDLGHYHRYVNESRIASILLHERGLDMLFQVGFPSWFDQTLISVGKLHYPKYRKAFADATLRDVRQIYADDPNVILQIEAPFELIAVLSAPRALRRLVARQMARGYITRFAEKCPAGARIGVHLCVGRLNNRAKTHLTELAPLVDLGNEIAAGWPDSVTLEYLHLPMSSGFLPPVLDPAWYADLERLDVPPEVRVILGVCHERATTQQLRPIVEFADKLLDRTVAVGASCGLALSGDRTLADVHTVLKQQAELCNG